MKSRASAQLRSDKLNLGVGLSDFSSDEESALIQEDRAATNHVPRLKFSPEGGAGHFRDQSVTAASPPH